MALDKYRKKRDLKKTPEPPGKILKRRKGTLSFVVQKHAARRLHYDFRLELDGVLKSWAVPKGPSLNPKDKRLAIQVEDHPLEYGKFEGIIPQGQYGAGKVEIWDKGTYTSADGSDLRKGLAKGDLRIILSGEKLNGEFVLVRIKKDPKKNQWLLIKATDDYSEEETKESPIKSKAHDKMPHHITPMLSTAVAEPFDDSDWIFEIKWDGYRAVAEITEKNIELYSRNLKSFKTHFPTIVHELQKIKGQVILDGEIVALDKDGRPNFQLLQQYLKTGKGEICYYVFDLLYLDHQDLRKTPLLERKQLLKEFLEKANQPSILFSDHVTKNGKWFFKEEKKLGLEGIMAKKKDSIYQSLRSKDWLKIKNQKSQEAIIIGFTKPQGSRKSFGSLLLAIRKNNKLEFIGHVGTGFNDDSLEEIYNKLKPLIVKKCPLEKEPHTNTPAIWVKPKLVCEVIFTEWTEDHKLRHPSFKGLRTDKSSKEVIMEKEIAIKPSTQTSFLTNLDKIYWKKKKYTKGDLINYYAEISDYILPYLKNRPLVMHRFPEGIEGEEFYQKAVPESLPSWIKTATVEHSEKDIKYMLIQDKPSLLYAVNLGNIELHPFSSTISHLDYPDYLIIDLDPEAISFKQVVKVALTLHEVLEEIKVPNFCKTSGKRGLHIYIPLGGKYSYDQAQQFAEIIAQIIYQKHSKITSLIRDPKKRQKKVYIDCLQNSRTKTVAAPYSVRPTPEASVATPLEWSEVNESLDPKKFTIRTIAKRLKEKGDLFKTLQNRKANMKSALKMISLYLNDKTI